MSSLLAINLCSPSLQDIRQKLEESLPGTGGGRNPHDQLVVKILFILPFCLLLFGYYQSCFQVYNLLLVAIILLNNCTHMILKISCFLNSSTWCFWQTNKELISITSLCAFARRARHKYKSEESLPSYSVVGSSSVFGISNQRVSSQTLK